MRAATSARRLPTSLLLAFGVAASGAVLAQVAAAAPTPSPPPTAVPAGQGPGNPPAAIREGRYAAGRLLYQSSCASCHGQQGTGSFRGPTLIGVGAASTDFQLTTGRMPVDEERASPSRGAPAFIPDDIDALVDYVSALGAGQGPDIPTVRPGNLAEGRELYLLNCAACHSASGSGYAQVGGRVAPSVLYADPIQVAEAIRVGPNLMPRFPDSVFDQQQLNALATYVQDLQRQDGPGGADLGRIGPVTETLAGFAGLALLLLVIRLIGKRAGA